MAIITFFRRPWSGLRRLTRIVVYLGAVLAGPAAAGSHAPPPPVGPPGQHARSALAAEIASALLGRAEDDAARGFYAARHYRPFWLARSGARRPADTLMAALWTADSHALPLERYEVRALQGEMERLEGMTSVGRARLELALTKAYLTYARDVASGLLEPRAVDREIHVAPERPDPATLLRGIAQATERSAFLRHLAPQHPDYDRLRGRYSQYRTLAARDAWGATLSAGPTLRPGDRSQRVATVRRRLMAIGDLARPSSAEQLAANEVVTDVPQARTGGDPRLYDAELTAAVERFQARHGLNQDGLVGPATRAALNIGPDKRARQIAVALERLRWLNRDRGKRHVVVNLAGFEMALVEDGERVFISRVIVGKARRHRTPEFSDEIEHMVINPTWNVPMSIAREEILPELQANPTYLAQKNMELVGSEIDPIFIDWSIVTPETFPGRIRQRPGSGNALGRVKFMFPNRFSIYLHDTPTRSLFARDMRAYSHGCIRVQRPLDFAYELLEPQESDPAAAFQRWLDAGTERYVHLREPVPVHVTYRTALVDAGGRDQFRGDIYRRDSKIADALERAGVVILRD